MVFLQIEFLDERRSTKLPFPFLFAVFRKKKAFDTFLKCPVGQIAVEEGSESNVPLQNETV